MFFFFGFVSEECTGFCEFTSFAFFSKSSPQKPQRNYHWSSSFWQMFESHILFIFLLLLLIFCFYTLCPFLCVTLAVLSICFACSSISHQEFVSPSKWLNDTSLLHLISHISSRDFALFCVTDLVPEQPSPPFSPPVGMRLEIKAHRLLSFYCHMTEITWEVIRLLDV